MSDTRPFNSETNLLMCINLFILFYLLLIYLQPRELLGRGTYNLATELSLQKFNTFHLYQDAFSYFYY